MQAVALRGPRSQALGVSLLLGLAAGLLVCRDPGYPPGVGARRAGLLAAGQENSAVLLPAQA